MDDVTQQYLKQFPRGSAGYRLRQERARIAKQVACQGCDGEGLPGCAGCNGTGVRIRPERRPPLWWRMQCALVEPMTPMQFVVAVAVFGVYVWWLLR
jgi:hypothetical protein